MAFQSLNKSMILLILVGYVRVKKKKLLCCVHIIRVNFGNGLGHFFAVLAKYALRFSEIAAGLVITSSVLVLSWFMSICLKGFRFTSSFTIFYILPLSLLSSIINSL